MGYQTSLWFTPFSSIKPMKVHPCLHYKEGIHQLQLSGANLSKLTEGERFSGVLRSSILLSIFTYICCSERDVKGPNLGASGRKHTWSCMKMHRRQCDMRIPTRTMRSCHGT